MNTSKLVPLAVLAFIVVYIGYNVLNAPDRRSAGQKLGDAVNELHNGPDKAARQLESRTPGDKLQDAVKDEKQDVKKSLNQQ